MAGVSSEVALLEVRSEAEWKVEHSVVVSLGVEPPVPTLEVEGWEVVLAEVSLAVVLRVAHSEARSMVEH